MRWLLPVEFIQCVSVCVCVGGVIPGPVTLLSVILFTEAAADDCCHSNRQPITRLEQQGVGVRPPRATGRTIPLSPPTSLLGVFFWVSVGGHVSDQLCRSDLKYLVERWVVFSCFSFPPFHPDIQPLLPSITLAEAPQTVVQVQVGLFSSMEELE